ncbi:MAG: AMP-binding protein [Alphaproteobacteria bacterium]|nr:AMP-binding protein [Alphaproteobacteria bacterium]
MNPYSERPWVKLYTPGQPADLTPGFGDALAIFRAAAGRAAEKPAVQYFDATLSYGDVDRDSDALAAALGRRGFRAGDRLAIYLQNVPDFVIAMLAAWKAGGIAVPVNPMNRERELGILLADARPAALVCHDTLHRDVVANLDEAGRALVPETVIVTSPADWQRRNDPRLFRDVQPVDRPGTERMQALLARHRGEAPVQAAAPKSGDTAFLVYTSGTTGLPKGAMNTHGNLAFNAQIYRDWCGLTEGVGVLGVAPLFHITGLVGHILAAFITASPLALAFRFDPGVMLDAAQERRPGFTVAAITALMAMMNHPDATAGHLESLKTIYSGGAPIPPAVVEQFRAKFGHYIHNIYGLTETSSPTHATPLGREAPVDPNSGALSVGVPISGAEVWIAAEDGSAAPVGEAGEIVSSGPMVVPGYWNKPAETAASMKPDGFRTGDVAFMDEAGWFYLTDRKKDMINAAGYKVWPREVEDVLYTHPAVREAAVVGVRDDYRGETVKAAVSLKAGAKLEPADLIAWCKPRMAAYKYPRQVVILPELPKTPTGKILRRELRDG